jgi:hypothetical protein
MSRHRFCMTSNRDAFIEELAEDIWDERRTLGDKRPWADADPETQLDIRKLAAETLRILEHGHG